MAQLSRGEIIAATAAYLCEYGIYFKNGSQGSLSLRGGISKNYDDQKCFCRRIEAKSTKKLTNKGVF